jgi:DNA-binding transcriptional MerR regulator
MLDFSIKEVVEKIGMSAPWMRRLEKMELIKPMTPKHQGKERRYSEADVQNALRLMALTTVGYTPQDVKNYVHLVNQFNELTQPFLRKERVRPEGAAVFLFAAEDVFPDGDPQNINWEEMGKRNWRTVLDGEIRDIDPGELVADAFGFLFSICEEAFRATMAIKNARKALRLSQGIEKEIDDKFIPALKHPILSPAEFGMEGVAVQGMAYQFRKAFEAQEEAVAGG